MKKYNVMFLFGLGLMFCQQSSNAMNEKHNMNAWGIWVGGIGFIGEQAPVSRDTLMDEKFWNKHWTANSNTKELVGLLLADEKDNGNRVKEFFKENKLILNSKLFKTHIDYPDAAFCTPLYFTAVIHRRRNVAAMLICQGAEPYDEFEKEKIDEYMSKNSKL